MPGLQDMRWTGFAFILGGIAFITILSGSDAVALPGSLISSILLAAGLSGLQALYGKSAGGFASNVLRIALIGIGLLLCLPLAVLALTGAVELIQEGLWILLFGGPAIMLLGLTLFGLAALRSRPMPRLNWLPAAAGIWYPIAYFLLAGYLFTHHGTFPQQYYVTLQIIWLIQSVALWAFGSILVADATRENAKGRTESSHGTP